MLIEDECNTCKGSGQIPRHDNKEIVYSDSCPDCQGTGLKRVYYWIDCMGEWNMVDNEYTMKEITEKISQDIQEIRDEFTVTKSLRRQIIFEYNRLIKLIYQNYIMYGIENLPYSIIHLEIKQSIKILRKIMPVLLQYRVEICDMILVMQSMQKDKKKLISVIPIPWYMSQNQN